MITSRYDCSGAQTLAGAIALVEASDAERDCYRRHLAQCGRCLNELGGERDVERVMSLVAQARDDERWEPDIRKALARRRVPRRAWSWGAGFATAVIVVAGVFVAEKKPPAAAPQHLISAKDMRSIAALDTQTTPPREAHAESLVVGSALPLTTTFAVSVDRRGTPLRCSITKSSGYSALDRAVCRAALRVQYKAPSH
jgi:Gram-negative bacterial TonB protein C-terminal